jgi:hypothetical protein
MPNPLLLQILRRAVFPQHRDSRMPEGVKPSLREFETLQQRMQHTL